MTHLQLAVQLLNDAGTFFEQLGAQNEPLKQQMDENANIYRRAAMLLQQDPNGTLPDKQGQQ